MTQEVKAFRAKDGTVFSNKHRANKYERKLQLMQTIEELPLPKQAKQYFKENWKDVKNLTKRFASVDMNEEYNEAEMIRTGKATA